MNRRSFTRTVLTGAGVAMLGPATLLTTGCNGSNISFYIDTIVGSLKALQPLLPGAAGLLAKAISVAGDLSAAYKRGDFASTTALFASLADLLNQIASDVGVISPSIKVILAVAGVALMTIANILANQAHAPTMTAFVKSAKAGATAAQLRGAAMIEKASKPESVDAVFSVLKAMQ